MHLQVACAAVRVLQSFPRKDGRRAAETESPRASRRCRGEAPNPSPPSATLAPAVPPEFVAKGVRSSPSPFLDALSPGMSHNFVATDACRLGNYPWPSP